jgi:hypothetical protein
VFDWLFGRKKADFNIAPADTDSLLMAEFGTSDRILPAYNDPTQIAEREIADIYVRDGRRGQILDAISKIPEVRTAINFWLDSVASSADGDDCGVATADFVDRRNLVPIDPQVEAIVNETIDRLFSQTQIQAIAKHLLSRGDEFCTEVVEKNKIVRLKSLPCWQTFRREPDGKLEGFYVKKYENDESADRYDPSNTYHFRFRPSGKYGKSLLGINSKDDAEYLLKRLVDLDFAARASAIDPLCHEMPPCATQEYVKNYKTSYQKKVSLQPVTDFFLMNGARMYRASGGNSPNLQAILGALNFNQIRLLMPAQVPFYLLGLNTHGAKEISGEPAMAFARAVSTLRANLTIVMKQALNKQLMLSGIPMERQKYRLIWPKIAINPYGQLTEQTDETNNEDTEK